MNDHIHKFPGKKKRIKRSAHLVHGPSHSQRNWLSRGISQAGGKLPLFDEEGQRYSKQTIRSCLEKGWAEPWFANPIKPEWLVCRLTDSGREVLHADS